MKKIITSALFLFALLNARGQYMSFFGDSTWEYHATCIFDPPEYPEDYENYPPPGPLGAYCHTYYFRFDKSHFTYRNGKMYYTSLGYSDLNYLDSLVWAGTAYIREDTMLGRLYCPYGAGSERVICDMSLSEGDTFIHPSSGGDRYMLVDSVRYISNRKTIFLSLINHQDDYFFGTGNDGLLSDYNFSIRFIEGVGATYAWGMGTYYGPIHPQVYTLSLLLCMHKDDSLLYMANEELGCVQTSLGVGVPEHPQSCMNVYPNPAKEYVVLEKGTGEEMHGSVVITDVLGRQWLQQRAEGAKCQIELSDLPVGMYFLTYSDGNRKVTRKFLKK